MAILLLIPFGLIGVGAYSARKNGSFNKQSKVMLGLGTAMIILLASTYIWLSFFLQVND